MKRDKLDINQSTKVAELLDCYPELEEVLIGMSSAFVNLKNPVMRKTVAKFASLKQAAMIGKVDIDFMVNTLRKAVNQPLLESSDFKPDN